MIQDDMSDSVSSPSARGQSAWLIFLAIVLYAVSLGLPSCDGALGIHLLLMGWLPLSVWQVLVWSVNPLMFFVWGRAFFSKNPRSSCLTIQTGCLILAFLWMFFPFAARSEASLDSQRVNVGVGYFVWLSSVGVSWVAVLLRYRSP